ncbi:hypothetical protein DESUT3_30950 [Desulfuromonas versatilis]|uniref:Uncharacterized protein n=1 Tax=Desulfuromonas versatilis TaxID=2802975 RepID=A0ABM8HUL7_9BACT|nr:hypothetical protein [Desulfuromonas versatilis]BCR06026.1 hypothetical protein DESUT3_30950 [Desulfuromonas versatilis]
MNAKLSQHMTLLGICAMIFYGLMLGTGQLSTELMPQFIISAVLFLSSGRIMRKAARVMARDEQEAKKSEQVAKPQADWPFLTALLNWTAALLIIGIMAVFLMKPIGFTFEQALELTKGSEQYFAGAVP